jgi:hypothetical protein
LSEFKDWTDCGLWKALDLRTGHHAKGCCTTLRRVMPIIQTVLASGGTSPTDFTLHDAGHSFRVAQRMQEIVGETIGTLSDFELSLLILSAYLHDIGMTPELRSVNAHYTYLLTGNKDGLADSEVDELQTWLDDGAYQIIPPISDAAPSAEQLELARELTTYYCRYRHNDWSANWIRKNLQGESLGNYDGWVEDLILLCQSHHFGGDRLKSQAFEPRWVGTPPVQVILRFLALVLRVADILEFDPERTPDVILHHRDISPESQIYWWKDRGISLMMSSETIVLTARPSSARIHKAIEEMVSAIDTELALCRRISEESPLGAMPGTSTPLPYKWAWPGVVHADITPREGTYEYIDGAFRPDTKKLLSLLSGTSLYQTPLHAVRELVQNAFDAVGERIAYKRLSQPNPASSILASQLAEQHRVSLQLLTDGPDAYLVCTDNGIGMTKAIIRDRVLVSGSSPRHDVRNLDRQCRGAGFQLGRSGQFGIGILSYFMIATNVEIETLRAQEAPDSESAAWHFGTEGVGSFGELRKLRGKPPGTQVRLRLTPEISNSLAEWYESLRSYLERTLVYCPCEFHFSSTLPACEPLELKPGWCPRDHDAAAFSGLESRDGSQEAKIFHLISSAERERRLAAKREVDDLRQEFISHLFWRVEEGVLPDGSAQYVIQIPYFQLEGGVSLAFLRARMEDKKPLAIHRFLNGTHFHPEGYIEEAWKGMAAGHSGWSGSRSAYRGGRSIRGAFLRVNWISDLAVKIQASRDAFIETKNRSHRWPEIEAHRRKMLDQFLEDFKDSKYAWLNERIAGRSPARSRRLQWLKEDEIQEVATKELTQLSWGEIKFPALNRSSFGYLFDHQGQGRHGFMLNDKPVSVIPWSVPAPATSTESGAIGWNAIHIPPDRVVWLEGWHISLAPIWLRRPGVSMQRPWIESKFPPQWSELCGANFDWYAGSDTATVVLNCNNSLVKKADAQAWSWCEQTFRESIDPVPQRDELLSDPSKAASWLLQCISRDSSDIWEGLPERDPELLTGLLGILFPRRNPAECWRTMFWVEDPGASSRLRVITPGNWKAIKDDVGQYLPTPPLDWRITRPDQASGAGYLRRQLFGSEAANEKPKGKQS